MKVLALILTFGLPLFAAETFDTALRSIVAKHVAIRVQKTNLSASETTLTAKRLFFLPNLSLSASQDKSALVDRDTLSTSRAYLATASINLFRSGADWTAMSAASADRDYQQSLYNEALLKAEYEGAAALLNLIETQQRSQVLVDNLKDLMRFQSIATERYKKGYLPLQEVDKVAIDVSNFDARMQNSQSDLNSARESLTKLWGRNDVIIDWPWKDKLNSQETNNLLNAKPKIELHPSLVSAENRYLALAELSREQFRRMLPSVDFSYSFGRYETASYNELGWESLITLKIPLFSGLSDYAQYRTRDEAKRAAEYQLEQEKQNALSNQSLAQNNFKIARATAIARERTVETAHKLLKTTLDRFRAGRASANDLNVDQNRVTESEILAQQGWGEAHLALLRLYHAFGKSITQ